MYSKDTHLMSSCVEEKRAIQVTKVDAFAAKSH